MEGKKYYSMDLIDANTEYDAMDKQVFSCQLFTSSGEKRELVFFEVPLKSNEIALFCQSTELS